MVINALKEYQELTKKLRIDGQGSMLYLDNTSPETVITLSTNRTDIELSVTTDARYDTHVVPMQGDCVIRRTLNGYRFKLYPKSDMYCMSGVDEVSMTTVVNIVVTTTDGDEVYRHTLTN